MFATGVHDIRYIFAGDKECRRQGEGKARVRVSWVTEWKLKTDRYEFENCFSGAAVIGCGGLMQ